MRWPIALTISAEGDRSSGRIKRTVEIELPRPRSTGIIASEAFAQHLGTIWEELKIEAARGMLAAETERRGPTAPQ